MEKLLQGSNIGHLIIVALLGGNLQLSSDTNSTINEIKQTVAVHEWRITELEEDEG